MKKKRDKESNAVFVEDADYDTYLLQGENELKWAILNEGLQYTAEMSSLGWKIPLARFHATFF